MRDVHPNIASAERGRALLPRSKVTFARLTPNVDTPLLATTDALPTIGHTYAWDGQRFYGAWRASDGISRVSVSLDGGLRKSEGTTVNDGSAVGTMRNGLISTNTIFGALMQLQTCIASSGQWQLRSTQLGTSAPLTLSWSNIGGLFGSGSANSSSLVRRIEAVIPLSATTTLVAEGRHDFVAGHSTIGFYLYNGSAWVQLNTTITLALTETPPSEYVASTWCTWAPYATFITAALDPVSGALVVVANGEPDADGYAVYFTVRNGVESVVSPVVDSDPEATSFRVMPASLATANGYLFLTAHITRKQTDLSGATASLGYDALLSYAHGSGFSFGDVSHWLTSQRALGQLQIVNDAGKYFGNGWVANITLGQLQGNATTTDLSDRLLGWNLHQISDGADSFGAKFTNADAGVTSTPTAVSGGLMKLFTQQANAVDSADPRAWTPIGQYMIDKTPSGIRATGRLDRSFSARDIGRALLADYVYPFTGQIRARGVFRSTLLTLDGLQRMTPGAGYSVGAGGLTVSGMNQPFLALADIANFGDDFLARMTVRAEVSDAYHLSTVGVVFGATADGEANVILIPKTNSWSGHTQPKPRLRKLALADVDVSDPSAVNTGWNLESRMWPLVEEAGEATAMTEDAGATYPTDSTYAIPVAQDTDVAVRVSGQYAYVYTKQRVLSPTQTAQYAKWTLQTVVLMATARKRWGGVTRLGLVGGTDVFASKTAFAGAFYGDQELMLTDAAHITSPRAGAYETAITGTVTELEGTPGMPDYAMSGSGTHFLTELRVGQTLRLGGHYRVIASIGTDTLLSFTDLWGPSGRVVGGNAYIRSSEFWAWASSANKDRTISSDLMHVNTGAIKRYLECGGYGLFISTDNTALQKKAIISNGVEHFLANADWDATWPGGGSTPNVWRLIFHQGLIARATAASYGLPDGSSNAYLITDDEIVRYVQASFTKFQENLSSTAYANTAYWLVVPTEYFVPAAQGNPSSSVTAGYGSVSAITAGMLFEISSRNSSGDGGYYALKQRAATPQQKLALYVVSNAAGTVTLGRYDEPLGTLATATPDVALGTGDVAVASGRGQFGTTKSAHDTDAPIAYYPCDANGDPARLIVSRFGAWSGLYTSTADMIKRVATTAGLRSPKFRTLNRPTSSAGNGSVTVASDATVTVDMVQQVSDFVLDIPNAYLPKSSTAWISVYFRAYYRLDIAQHTAGTVNIRLCTVKTRLTGGIDDYGTTSRSLEAVDVVLGPSDLSASTASRVALRVIVQGDEVIVEIERQPVWTFDLSSLTDGANSYYVTGVGDLKLGNIAVGSSLTMTVAVQELGAEVGDVAIRAKQSALDVIGQTIGERRISHRSTSDGGVEWGTHIERDDGGALTENLTGEDFTNDESQLVNHVVVVSDGVSGEVVDDAGARANGYRLDVLDSRTARTILQAQDEAQLALREAREFAVQRSIAGAWFSALQPLDKVRLSYTLGSTGVTRAGLDLVITAIETEADQASIKSRFETRRYIA